MPIRPASRPFALGRQPNDTPARLRRALASMDFAEAARVFHEEDSPLPTALGDDSLTAGRDERQVQAYFQSAPTPGGEAGGQEASVSAAAAHEQAGALALDTTRWSAAVGGDLTPGASLQATALPVATVIGADVRAGGTQLQPCAFAGAAVKGAKLGADGGLGWGAFGLAVVHRDKVRVLGPTITAADGQTLHLARFSTSVAPSFEADLTVAAHHLGVGLRAAAYRLSATTYEKYVSAPDLARLMRQRDRWCRNLVEFAHATRLAAGCRPTSLQSLARDLAQVDAWLPGERASWQSGHGLVLGLGLGALGGRAIGTVSLTGDVTLTLEREDEEHVVLSVEPGKQAGVRFALEARLVADVAVDVGRSVRHRRAWRFDTTYMSSRHALARALGGSLPGIILPGRTSDVQATLDYATLHQAEKLPFGVEAVESAFAIDRSQALSLSGLRLPELVGGQSLFASAQRTQSVSSSTSGSSSRHSVSSARSSSSGLLSLGSSSETSLVELVSEAEHPAAGAKLGVPHVQSLKASYEFVTGDSGTFMRRRLARRMSAVTGVPIALDSAAKTTGYAARIAIELDIADLGRIAAASPAEVASAAAAAGLRPAAAQTAQALIARFIDDGHGEGAISELAFVARFGYPGLRLLRLLAGHADVPAPTVTNDAHIALLRDFLKLEVYALGARDQAHARRALKRAEGLAKRLGAAANEMAGDGALGLSGDEAVAQHTNLVEAMLAEVSTLRDQLGAGILT